jgi:hypothetical protein
MYKVIKEELPALEKRIKGIGKKLDKYGLAWSFKTLGESVEKVNVYKNSEIGRQWTKIDEVIVDVVSYDFSMEPLKIGEWVPIAVIEHMALTLAEGTQNMVHAIGDAETLPHWWTIESNCDHCKSKRERIKTVILQNASGEYKQVGTTCIKDFTGIDAADIISVYASVSDIYIEETAIYGESFYRSNYTETRNYLAHCVKFVAEKGYDKEVTKYRCYEIAREEHAEQKYLEQAQEIIDYYSNLDFKFMGNFDGNTKTAVTSQYSKISGLIAYAPLAYQKAIEYDRERALREIENAKSQHQGNVGDKITVNLEHTGSYGYESDYGYMFIHLFKDENGNVYKWNTAKSDCCGTTNLTVSGTIKAHSEYDGQKQTVLTRCKVQVA